MFFFYISTIYMLFITTYWTTMLTTWSCWYCDTCKMGIFRTTSGTRWMVFRLSSCWLWARLCTASTSLMSWKGKNLPISNGYCHQCTVFKNNQWIFFIAKNVLKTLMWLIMWIFMMKAILNLMKYGYMLLLSTSLHPQITECPSNTS